MGIFSRRNKHGAGTLNELKNSFGIVNPLGHGANNTANSQNFKNPDSHITSPNILSVSCLTQSPQLSVLNNLLDDNVSLHTDRSRSNSRTTPGLKKKTSKLSMVSTSLHDDSNSAHLVRKTQSKLHNLVASTSSDSLDGALSPYNSKQQDYQYSNPHAFGANHQQQQQPPPVSSSSNSYEISKIRQLNFGLLANAHDSGAKSSNNTNTNSNSSDLMYNITSNNTTNTNITAGASDERNANVAPQQKKRVQRKISINELNHIRSNSLSTDLTSDPRDSSSTNFVPAHSFTNLDDSSSSSHIPQQDTHSSHGLSNKKSFTFFNKLMKGPKTRSKYHTNNQQNNAQENELDSARRYANNQDLDIVQTKLDFNDTLDDNFPQINDIRKRNMDELYVNPEGRLSTLTEDSFYFNSRTPTTPVYTTANNSNSNSNNNNNNTNINATSNASSNNLKPLPEIRNEKLAAILISNMLDLPPAIKARSRSPSPSLSSLNKELPDTPVEKESKLKQSKSNNTDNDDEQDTKQISQLLPPLGDDIDDELIAPRVREALPNTQTSGYHNNNLSAENITATVSPRSLKSPNSNSNRLSRIISKISFNGLTSPKNRSSMISLKNGSNKKSNKTLSINGEEDIKDLENYKQSHDFSFIGQSSVAGTPRTHLLPSSMNNSESDRITPVKMVYTPQRRHNRSKSQENSLKVGANNTGGAHNDSADILSSNITSSLTPTVDKAVFDLRNVSEASPFSNKRQNNKSLNNNNNNNNNNESGAGRLKPSTTPIDSPASDNANPLINSSKNTFRSPSKRLSRRFSEKFSTSPLMSFYRSASPKKLPSSNEAVSNSIDGNVLSPTEPRDEKLEAIAIPELEQDNLLKNSQQKVADELHNLIGGMSGSKGLHSTKSENLSDDDDVQIIEALSLVTPKKVSGSPASLQHSSDLRTPIKPNAKDKSAIENNSTTNKNLPYQLPLPASDTFGRTMDSFTAPKLDKLDTGTNAVYDEEHNYSQLSPIDEIDSPESAYASRGRGELTAKQREMPSITSSLNKLSNNSVSRSGSEQNFRLEDPKNCAPVSPTRESKGSHERVFSSSDASFHTTDTALPSPTAALVDSDASVHEEKGTPNGQNKSSKEKQRVPQPLGLPLQELPKVSITDSHEKGSSKTSSKEALGHESQSNSIKTKSQGSLLNSEVNSDFFSPTNSPYVHVRQSSSLSRAGKTQPKLPETLILEDSQCSNANNSSSNISNLGRSSGGNNSSSSVNNITARGYKARSPRAMTLHQEDFLTRSAKTLSTISANRKTLRPISAAFRTPHLPDYEDEFGEDTPILAANGKNNSQITLNFDEKPLVGPADVGSEDEALIHDEEEEVLDTPEALKIVSESKDVTKQVPKELAEILQKEGFNEFMSPKSVDINYENFARSGESSPSSEFEFASPNDYNKKEGKKLDFGLASTPIEMSKDPIFANILKNNKSVASGQKSPPSLSSTGVQDLTVAPIQPRYPAPTPANYHHPTITEESESEAGSASPKTVNSLINNAGDAVIGVASVAQNVRGNNADSGNSNENNPFLDSNDKDAKSIISLPKKSSQLSLNKILYSNTNNANSTVSDLDASTVQISSSNSNRTLTKGLFTPSSSPFKSEKAGIVRRSSQLKHSNSLRLISTPRGKKTGALSSKTPETQISKLSPASEGASISTNDYTIRSPESAVSGISNSKRSPCGSPKHRPRLSNSTNESVYQEVYGNLKLREEFKGDLSLNTMKKSPSVSSLDLKGRHKSRHYSSNLHTNSSINLVFENSEESNELASLFVKAIHSFDSSSLNSEDTAICLTFEKDDIAFVFNIDESGWGEVVLLSNLSKGWVPMNYFKAAIDESMTAETPAEIAESRKYLKPLFIAAAEFLLNPQEVPVEGTDLYTFSTKHMNDIRDGVKLLLQYTDCISRTAPVVHKRPVIRKVRKALLADWYTLMSKAEKYKGTASETKIDFLKAMTYKVLIKALAFLDIWGNESETYEKEKEKERIEKRNRRRSRRRSKQEKVLYLDRVPFAAERLLEVKRLLFQYLSLILGRLDIIENNFVGCEQLESVIHQVILLLRELLFIGKSATILLNSSNYSLDNSLDNLLAFVSDLVTSVKHLVSKADSGEEEDSDYEPSIKDEDYFYSKEATKLIRVVAQMIVSISKAMDNCQRLLHLTKDFQLNIYRKYPDFEQMRITPEEFIRKCVSGLTDNQILSLKINRMSGSTNKRRSGDSFRYSHIRGGSKKHLSITPDGSRVLREYMNEKTGSGDSSIIPVTNEEYDAEYSTENLMKDIVYDSDNNVIGATFKSLVFLLANERSYPNSFFIATFFMNFRNFASTKELLHELIKRFDVGDREKEFLTRNNSLRINELTAYDSRLKKRRKTILTIVQVWLESYWSYEKDFPELPTLINFLNEGASYNLPDETLGVLELCAKLAINHPSKKKVEKFNAEYLQLISRRIGLPRKDSVVSEQFTTHEGMSASNSESDLSSMSSNSSVSSLVSLNLSLNFSSYHISSIMNKNQVSALEKSVMAFRHILGDQWPTPSQSDEKVVKLYQPIELGKLINAWFNACAKKLSIEPPAVSTELTNHNALEIAKQLTDIESKIFLAIQPDELLDDNFREKRIHLQKSPNIERSVLFTNLLSDLVLDTTLSPGMSMKARISTLKQWLKVSLACYQLRNYNSLAAIMTILQSSSISRLDKLWVGLSSKYSDTFDFLVKIINPNKNYKIYRNLIKPYLVTDERKCNVPIVPYINLFLQDIIFANDGNRSKRVVTIDNEQKTLINFDKYSKIVNTISELEFFQVGYPESNTDNASSSNVNSITSPVSKASVFSFSPSINSNGGDNLDAIVPNPALEEFILLKLWATNQFNLADSDRFWKYSMEIQPLTKD